MIERVGKEFPTLFICVRKRVSPYPLEPKGGLEVGPAAASPWLSSALRRYRRAKSLSFQALQIRATSWAPQAPLLAVGLGSHWTAKGDRDKVEGVQRRVSLASLKPKGGLEVGPAAASPWLSSALRRYRRARSLAFQALLIREASSAPQAPLLAVV